MNDRTEWLKERRTGLGGSDMAAVLGISPWRTPVEVWMDKTGKTPVRESNSITLRIGQELEDMVARLYTEDTGRPVQRFNKMIHDDCFLGNLDRLVVMEGQKVASHMGKIRTKIGLECKTTSVPVWEDVPAYYLTQVFHYMGLCPMIERFDVACLFLLGKEFKIYPIERDQEIIDSMREEGMCWWAKYVLGNKMPPPINEADCKLLWARSNPGKTIETNSTISEDISLIADLKQSIKTFETKLKEKEDTVKAYMGDAEIITDATGKPLVTWKSSKDRTTTDWKGIANELGFSDDQKSKYTVTKPGSRVFLIKK